MKIAIVTDTHWGVRNDNQVFADYISKFYKEIFFPTIKEKGVDAIFHLGDVVDRRKYINFLTARRLEEDFIKPISEMGIPLHAIAGNHDTFYKNTNEINSLKQLYGNSSFDNIHLYWKKPVELDMDGCKIMLAPWLCADNWKESLEMFKSTSAQVLMGHFEIAGFEMDKGHICADGMDKDVFSMFDSVYSGHFHQPSTHGNISYLGSPYEMTWSDYDQKRGFNIFDTETREMEYIQNPFRMFHKVWYDDKDMTIEDIANLDTSELSGTQIKVIIQHKENPYIFDLFLDKLHQSGAADIKVVEDHMNMDVLDEDELVDEAQDTMTILRNYIDNLEFKGDKKKVEDFVQELYQEAVNL
jgi:DNA repair exonuclease SbcCD nuclease subunit